MTPSAAKLPYQAALANFASRAARLLRRAPEGVEREAFLEAARLELLASALALARPARGMYGRVALVAKREVAELLGRSIPPNQAGDLKAVFAARQVALVQRAIGDQLDALRANSDPADLKALRHRLRLIADNEAHKLFEAEVERWAGEAGEVGGWYVTARDERVRTTHRQHDGRFYLFSERPPEMGEINCRCRLVPRRS